MVFKSKKDLEEPIQKKDKIPGPGDYLPQTKFRKIHLNKEDFMYGLALSDDYGQPVLNESIYYPTAFLVGKRMVNGQMKAINESIEFGVCNINDFGDNFKKFTSSMNLNLIKYELISIWSEYSFCVSSYKR